MSGEERMVSTEADGGTGPRWFGGVKTAAAVAALVMVSVVPASASGEPQCADSTMYVVAHQDDTLIFTSPALLHDIQAGDCVQTVFVTAGDANDDETYWSGREAGAEAAYADLAQVDDEWSYSTRDVAGVPVRVATLDAAPQVSLVYLRLPDGADRDGDGGSRYGYQSIKKLWQGTLAQIDAVDGSASYTRQGLIDTLHVLMETALPTRIVTQDYVGELGDADNVDHHVTALFTRAAHDLYTTAHVLVSYMGYGVTSLPSNVAGADLAAKQSAYYAYAAHDPKICQTPEACAGRPESQWLSREYVVASEDGGSDPGAQRVNVAQQATATASSADVAAQEGPEKAIDGVAAGYPQAPTNEWATVKGKAGSWLQLSWPQPQTIDRVVLYDRPNPTDQVTSGLLTFADGYEIAVSGLPNDGSPLTVNFSQRSTTSLRFTATSVLKGTLNVGLAEIEAWSPNAGQGSPQLPVANAGADQQVEPGALVTLSGAASSDPEDRPLSYVWSQVSGPSVSLSSSSVVAPTFTAPSGPATLTFSLVVRAGSQSSVADTVTVGVAAPAPSKGSVNVASAADVTASSQNVAEGQSASKAVDNIVSGYPADASAEWSTVKGKAGSWIQLSWASAQTLERVVFYDRPNEADRVTSGTLTFSDGSSVDVGALPDDGTALVVPFPERSTTSLRFTVTGTSSTTLNVGLAELEAWTSGPVDPPVVVLPTARAGDDQAVKSGDLVTLDGSASSSGSGGALTYAWEQTDGPVVQLSSTSSSAPSFSAPEGPASLVFALTVSNSAGTSTTDAVTVTVAPPLPGGTARNVAPIATISASSQNLADGQGALKAVDGVVAGYPENATAEWSTIKGKVGSWLGFEWSQPQTVSKVVLYDRPNPADNITGATLMFGDGSQVTTGPLPNDGSPLVVAFPARTVTDMGVVVTGVLKGTVNVGLAEVEVWTQ